MMVELRHANRVSAFGTADRGHAAVPIPGGSRLLLTSGRDGRARIYDATGGTLIFDIAVGRNPDAAIWDARLVRRAGHECAPTAPSRWSIRPMAA